jgi:hypothetical protein
MLKQNPSVNYFPMGKSCDSVTGWSQHLVSLLYFLWLLAREIPEIPFICILSLQVRLHYLAFYVMGSYIQPHYFEIHLYCCTYQRVHLFLIATTIPQFIHVTKNWVLPTLNYYIINNNKSLCKHVFFSLESICSGGMAESNSCICLT